MVIERFRGKSSYMWSTIQTILSIFFSKDKEKQLSLYGNNCFSSFLFFPNHYCGGRTIYAGNITHSLPYLSQAGRIGFLGHRLEYALRWHDCFRWTSYDALPTHRYRTHISHFNRLLSNDTFPAHLYGHSFSAFVNTGADSSGPWKSRMSGWTSAVHRAWGRSCHTVSFRMIRASSRWFAPDRTPARSLNVGGRSPCR